MSDTIDFPPTASRATDEARAPSPSGAALFAAIPPTLLALGLACLVTLVVSVAAAAGAPALPTVRVLFVVGAWAAIGLLLAYTFLPGFDLLGRTQRRAGARGERVVALTIDDGPHPASTEALLAALDRAGVKATFFLRGDGVEQWPHLARSIVEAGHTVGNHTQRHRLLVFRTSAQVDEELQTCQRAVERLLRNVPGSDGDRRVTLFRPPHGFKPIGLQSALRKLGLRNVAWHGSIRDTDAPGTETIVRRAVALARPGAILLLHDNPTCDGQTAAAIPRIVDEYRALGYRFVTLE